MKKNHTLFILFILLISFSTYLNGQIIGLNNPTPDASAILDMVATNRGALIPRVALTATNAVGPIAAPADALLIYNTATAGVFPNDVSPGFYYYNTATTSWLRFFGTGIGNHFWDLLKGPATNLSLAHGANTTAFTFNSVTTATALGLSSSSLATGTLFSLSTSNAASTGNALLISSNSTGALANGIVRFNYTAAHTNNGLQLDDATATGKAFALNTNSITSGKAFSIASSATAFIGTLASFSLTGDNVGNTSAGIVFKASGTGAANTGTVAMFSNAGTGLGLRVNDDGTDTDVTPVAVDAAGNLGVGTASPASRLHVFETTGTASSGTTGSIYLEHADNGGQSSILFKSAVNAGNDYGYLRYSDDGNGNGSNSENSLMELGVKNDGVGANQDDIAIMSSGYLGVFTTSAKAHFDVRKNSMRFGAGTTPFTNSPTAQSDASDAMALYAVSLGGADTDFRFYFEDDATDKMSFWGNSCGGGVCNSLSNSSNIMTLIGNGRVGINQILPDASAKLEIAATNMGMLIPRVALTATNATAPVTAPADGLLVYNTATAGGVGVNVSPGFYFYNASTCCPAASWIRIFCSSDVILDPYWSGKESPITFLALTHGIYTTSMDFSNTTTDAFTMNNNTLTTGNAWVVNSSSAGITSGSLLKVSSNGIIGNVSGSMLNLTSSAANTNGYLGTIVGNSIAAGGLFNVSSSSAVSTGTLAYIGSTGANTGTVAMISNAGTGLGLRINDDGTDADATPIAYDAIGNLGLGTALPSVKLHIYEAPGTTLSGSTGSLILEHGDNGGQSSILFKSKSNTGSDYGYMKYSDDGSGNGSTAQNGLLEIGVQNDGVANSPTNEDDIAFMSSGYMGISTVAPKAKLHIYEATGVTSSASSGTLFLEHGNSGGQSNIVFKSTANAGTDYGYLKYSDDASGNGSTADNGLLEFGVQAGAAGATSQDDIAIIASGNIGIGTTSPKGKLHIYETVGTIMSGTIGTLVLSHGNSGGQSGIVFKSKNNAGVDYGYMKFCDDCSGNGSTSENSVLEIGVQSSGAGASQDDIALMPTGYLGIGTQSPGEPLHISKTSNSQMMLQNTAGGSTANLDFQTAATVASILHPMARISTIDDAGFSSHIAFLTKNSGAETNPLAERMRMTATGSLGIGTTAPVTNSRLAINNGHLQSQQTTAPTVATGAASTAVALTNATDVAGNISITTNTTAGVGATVTFNKTYTTAPIVVIVPAGANGANAATQMVSAKIYVTSTTSTFVINFGAAPTATVKTFSYKVIETQ